MNLLRHVQIATGSTIGFSGGDKHGSIIDCADCEGVMWIVHNTSKASVNASTSYYQIAGSSANSTGAMTAYTNTICKLLATATTAKTNLGKIAAIDLYKPLKRYNMLQAKSSTGAAGGNTVTVLKYGLRRPGTTGWISTSTEISAVKMAVSAT